MLLTTSKLFNNTAKNAAFVGLITLASFNVGNANAAGNYSNNQTTQTTVEQQQISKVPLEKQAVIGLLALVSIATDFGPQNTEVDNAIIEAKVFLVRLGAIGADAGVKPGEERNNWFRNNNFKTLVASPLSIDAINELKDFVATLRERGSNDLWDATVRILMIAKLGDAASVEKIVYDIKNEKNLASGTEEANGVEINKQAVENDKRNVGGNSMGNYQKLTATK